MPPRRTLTGKAAMASRRAEFLAAHDRTQNGREAVASRRAEFIAARDLRPMWAEFELAKAEWAVEQEAAKATHRSVDIDPGDIDPSDQAAVFLSCILPFICICIVYRYNDLSLDFSDFLL